MKLLPLAASVLFALSSRASDAYVTNYAAAVPWYREVDGKLYNTKQSQLWMEKNIRIDHVYTNGVVASVWSSDAGVSRPVDHLNSIGAFTGGAVPVRTGGYLKHPIFIRNFPISPPPIDGKSLTVKLMRAGTYKWIYDFDEQMLEQWDFGTPHFAPVITTNSMAASSPTVRP